MAKNSVSIPEQQNNIFGALLGIILVVLLAVFAHWLKLQVYNIKNVAGLGIPGSVLEYPIWAVILGLILNPILKRLNIYHFLKPGFRTELFLKVGLVLLGAGINIVFIAKAGMGGILQGIIMVTSVFFFSWWLSGKFGLPDKLRAVMSTAIAVCGVSAAIAAAGAVLAKKEEITYITTLVIIVALPLMVLSPILASAMNLPEPVAGAWFGGNVDTTAAVVGAGTIYGKVAQEVATIVKSSQNALIGVVAFLLSLYFSTVVNGGIAERPSLMIIWQRFPKFVLGFIFASILLSIGLIPAAAAAGKDLNVGNVITWVKDWAFCIAFVCKGLDVSFGELKKMGWNPFIVYIIVTIINTTLALIVAWLIFGVLFPYGK